MRRRIYIDPESELSDQTLDAYLFHEEGPPPDGVIGLCDVGALYDDELWEKYEAACRATYELRRQICAKLVYEPYDDVELRAGTEWDSLHNLEDDAYDQKRAELRQRLLDNAKSKVKP